MTYHHKSRRFGQVASQIGSRRFAERESAAATGEFCVLLRREGRRHGQDDTRRIYRVLGPAMTEQNAEASRQDRWDDCRPATRSNETGAMGRLATGASYRIRRMRRTCDEKLLDSISCQRGVKVDHRRNHWAALLLDYRHDITPKTLIKVIGVQNLETTIRRS